jgi:hypothetical protein
MTATPALDWQRDVDGAAPTGEIWRIARPVVVARGLERVRLYHLVRDDQDHESDRQQPQQVEPPAASDPHAGRDAVRDRPEPAQVLGSTTSSPTASCERKLDTASGVTPDSCVLGGGSTGWWPRSGRPSPPLG